MQSKFYLYDIVTLTPPLFPCFNCVIPPEANIKARNRPIPSLSHIFMVS